MSVVNLFLLGFLMEDPMNPYELAKLLDNNDVREMIRISKPSIYKNLKKLGDNGFLIANTVKEGEMPEKTVYKINKKGREYFLKLMKQYAERDIKYHFDFNSMLINLDKVSPEKGLELINKIGEQLKIKKERYVKYIKQYSFLPLEAMMIIKQQQMLNETLLRWLEEFREKYQKKTHRQK